MEHPEDTPKWPIIVNETLTGSEIYKILEKRGHKLRGELFYMLNNIIILFTVSSGTVPNTCIYPSSSVAFLIVLLQEAVNEWQPSKGISKALISRYGLLILCRGRQ